MAILIGKALLVFVWASALVALIIVIIIIARTPYIILEPRPKYRSGWWRNTRDETPPDLAMEALDRAIGRCCAGSAAGETLKRQEFRMSELHKAAFDRMVWWWQKPGDSAVSDPERQRELDEAYAQCLAEGAHAVVDGKVRCIADGHFLGATPEYCVIRCIHLGVEDEHTVRTECVDRIEFIPKPEECGGDTDG